MRTCTTLASKLCPAPMELMGPQQTMDGERKRMSAMLHTETITDTHSVISGRMTKMVSPMRSKPISQVRVLASVAQSRSLRRLFLSCLRN